MKPIWIPLVTLLVLGTATAKEFTAGQIWQYHTRSHEAGSELTVVQVDDLNDERIIHISLTGLKVKNPQAESGFAEHIAHIPISPDALRSSVIELTGYRSELPDYQAGYQMWREAFDAGKGGFFTLTVAECIEHIEQAINP